jgi:hypothetical protein
MHSQNAGYLEPLRCARRGRDIGSHVLQIAVSMTCGISGHVPPVDQVTAGHAQPDLSSGNPSSPAEGNPDLH